MFRDQERDITSRALSYKLVRQQLPLDITETEFEDAKKERLELIKQRSEALEDIEREKKETDERLSAADLQFLMAPVEILDKRIDELTSLIANARIVKKTEPSTPEPAAITVDTSSHEEYDIPTMLFFVKDGKKIEAKPGNYAPFYAIVDGEYIGYNRMILSGWTLVDDENVEINEQEKLQALNKVLLKKERERILAITKQRHPNAYAPWTDEENQKLLDMYTKQNKGIVEIASLLQRTNNGIALQLKKLLNLKEKPSWK